jgi:alpha-glucosidase
MLSREWLLYGPDGPPFSWPAIALNNIFRLGILTLLFLLSRTLLRSRHRQLLIGLVLSVPPGLYLALHGERALRLDVLIMWDSVSALWNGGSPEPRLLMGVPQPPPMELPIEGTDYLVRWSAAAQLAVLLSSSTGGHPHEVWKSRPGMPFVSAASSDVSVAESRGNFYIRDRILWECPIQRVDAVEKQTDAPGVVVRGAFVDHSGGRCDGLRWSLAFYPTDGSSQISFHLGLEGGNAADANRVQLAGALSPTVPAVWGLGVQVTHFNMRGHCVPIFVTEGGVGRGTSYSRVLAPLLNMLAGGAGGNDYTTYQASASYVTSAGDGLVLTNSEFSLIDLASDGCREAGLLTGGRFGSTGRSASVGAEAAVVTVHAPTMSGRLFTAFSSGHAMPPADKNGFFAESRHLRALEALTSYVGRQPPLPEWADKGAIIGMQGGTQAVRKLTAHIQQAGVPIVALWLQDWIGKRSTLLGHRLWWNWELDDSYADWAAMRDELGNNNPPGPIRLLRYVNPMFADVLSAGHNTSRPQYQQAVANGYLVRASAPGGEHGSRPTQSSPPPPPPYMVEVAGFEAALLDLTNPRARQWMRDDVLRAEVLGHEPTKPPMSGSALKGGSMADGWMADFGEALPCDGVSLHDGTPPCTHHNEFPIEWARLNGEAVRAAGVERDVVIFHRSGFTTSPSVAGLFWLGDQLHTWDEHDGLASTITATLSGGFSGYSLTHSDVGGYNGGALWAMQLLFGVRIIRARELLCRWSELNAFSGAVFRTHEGLTPDRNHQVWSDSGTLAHFRRFALIFAAFRPYRRQLMDETATRGWPVVRHPVLHFPDDPVLLSDRDEREGGLGRIRQFMLGADWLIVPIIAPGVSVVRGYVPGGSWVPLFCSGRGAGGGVVHGPGWQILPAPLGEPAVYHRVGAKSAAGIRQTLHEQGVLHQASC